MIERIRYTCPGASVVWRDCKAGVIDDDGRTIVPFRFDEVYIRSRTIRAAQYNQPSVREYLGFACFTHDGESLALDMKGNPDRWRDWELHRLEPKPLPDRTVKDLEAEIERRYEKGEDREALEDLMLDRRLLLDHKWQHSPDNVAAIGKVNEMLKETVKEALKMADLIDGTIKSQGSDKIWHYEIEVIPVWKEGDFRNILPRLGHLEGITGACPCLTCCGASDEADNWNLETVTLEDGVSWDEYGFELPTYQNIHFIYPFQNISEHLIVSYSDLASIEQFEIGIHLTHNTLYDV